MGTPNAYAQIMKICFFLVAQNLSAPAVQWPFVDRKTANAAIEPTHLFTNALQRYQAMADKSWSLSNCASFFIMEERLTAALTHDRHFAQAGFKTLLGGVRCCDNSLQTTIKYRSSVIIHATSHFFAT
jgi:hypothetical protein